MQNTYSDISSIPPLLTNLSLFLYLHKIWFLLRPPPTYLINVIKYPVFSCEGAALEVPFVLVTQFKLAM